MEYNFTKYLHVLLTEEGERRLKNGTLKPPHSCKNYDEVKLLFLGIAITK